MENREIEVKFLEIDKPKLIEQLKSLGAHDLGEELLTQQIFVDKAGNWHQERKFVRIRKTSKGVFVTYKHVQERTAEGTEEIEFTVNEPEKVNAFLQALGLAITREDEKRRHKFMLGEVVVDIDSWPKVPTYVELEGPSEAAIKEATSKLGFDWSKGVFGTATMVVEEVYKIPMSSYRYFTFDRVE